jgi:hypothetical protein
MSSDPTLRVAFAGAPGSFAEDAVLAAYPAAEAVPVPVFADVVTAVVCGEVKAGVLPIENVVGGGVREVYDLLLDTEAAVVGEVIVPVRLCLAGLPGDRLEDIERVYSHIQALTQAEPFLRSREWTLLAATNTAGAGREIGWYSVDVTEAGQDDPVLSTFGQRREVFQWHDDVIELPDHIEHLAGSEICPVQAFRHGEHAYGFQFHLEVDGALIERWLTIPQHQSEFADGAVDPEQIRGRIDDAIAPLVSLSNSTFGRWVERFEIQPRRRHLPSR